jgi:hypothetical protein
VVILTGFVAAGVMMMGLLSIPSTAYAQCTPLTSGLCKPETSWPHDYSFTQGINYWAVVGVVPTNPDDKDIYIYPSCASGTPVGGSGGTSGIDFVVGDFNHTTMGTYYPKVTYGNASAFHNVYWRNGGLIFPVSSPVFGQLGGPGAGCNMMQIYDVYLQQGQEYRIDFRQDLGSSANAALFRNPSMSAYWAGRSLRVFEIPTTGLEYYTAPASDWYGLVVFPIWNLPATEDFEVHVEKLNDCIPLSPGVCVNNKLYTAATGPANDYTFTQELPHWAIVAVLPDALDDKALLISQDCDGVNGIIQGAYAGVGDTDFIVADFNHTPVDQYYARIEGGNTLSDYSIQWDDDPDIFPVPGEITGTMDGLAGSSVCVKMWEVYLEAGLQYRISLDAWGPKDPHLALFRNPTTGTYWAHRGDRELELWGADYDIYTTSQSDWYGLVVFADERKTEWSSYKIGIEPLYDCVQLTSMVCIEDVGWPRDFTFTRATPYWAAVALSPSSGDLKELGVYQQCDGGGSIFAYSSNSGTSLVVGDFNHTPTGTFYPRVTLNYGESPYTVACDTGNETFPFDIVVEGTVGGTTGDCGLVRIWDVLLNAGTTYRIGFTRSGLADVRLALFRNPGSGTYWTDRTQAVWEYSASGNYTYTAPASDWYGLVVFPNVRLAVGNYTIRISNAFATGIDSEPFVPTRFALYQSNPNPFKTTTTIRYDVPASGGKLTLAVFDISGKLVRTLVDRVDSPGENTVEWDGRSPAGEQVSTGVYFYRLTAGDKTLTKKMVLLK